MKPKLYFFFSLSVLPKKGTTLNSSCTRQLSINWEISVHSSNFWEFIYVYSTFSSPIQFVTDFIFHFNFSCIFVSIVFLFFFGLEYENNHFRQFTIRSHTHTVKDAHVYSMNRVCQQHSDCNTCAWTLYVYVQTVTLTTWMCVCVHEWRTQPHAIHISSIKVYSFLLHEAGFSLHTKLSTTSTLLLLPLLLL